MVPLSGTTENGSNTFHWNFVTRSLIKRSRKKEINMEWKQHVAAYFFQMLTYSLDDKPASKLSGVLLQRGGKRKEGLQLHLRNLNICIEKVNAKCWLAEMTLVMTSLLLARVFQSLFTFALIGQFQKISIPNHRRLPCFNPPLPLEIPKCVTPPFPQNSIIVNPPPPPLQNFRFFGKYIFD